MPPTDATPKKPSGWIRADPNPLCLADGERLGVTTLSWSAEGTGAVEVHVGTADGPVFSRGGASGDATTGKWVEDGMVFYLQDVGQSQPPTSAHTLDTVIVHTAPPVGTVSFGDLRRLTPISSNWGYDRGRPIDRYYIETFLAAHSHDIHGRVLEIGDNNYTREFGTDRVIESDVLNFQQGVPGTTIVGDLESAPQIPSNTFDCIILTQTLQLIYNVSAAVKTAHRILKPGGVLLATFPGISQTYDDLWADKWYWNFTVVSAQRLFEEVFSIENVTVQGFGNVLAATAFLQGLAVAELNQQELDYTDLGYEVTITARALKEGFVR